MRQSSISLNATARLAVKKLGLLRGGALAGVLLAAGCASSADLQELREAPGFQAGYVDGCETASEREKSFSTKEARDDYAFENDEAYRAGWRRGYMECGDIIPEPKDGGRILGEGGEH